MMITLVFLLVFPAIALSRAIIRNETSPVCSLQVRDKVSRTSIERTNDWTIIPWTNHTLWPTANFFLTLDGELYGANGQFCSFSPNLKCTSSETTASLSNFTITQNGSVSLGGKTEFWLCPDPDGDAHHAEAAPLILPPKGSLSQGDEPDYGSCNVTVLTSASCHNKTEFKLDPQKIMLGSGDTSSQQETTGDAGRTVWSVRSVALTIVTTLLLCYF